MRLNDQDLFLVLHPLRDYSCWIKIHDPDDEFNDVKKCNERILKKITRIAEQLALNFCFTLFQMHRRYSCTPSSNKLFSQVPLCRWSVRQREIPLHKCPGHSMAFHCPPSQGNFFISRRIYFPLRGNCYFFSSIRSSVLLLWKSVDSGSTTGQKKGKKENFCNVYEKRVVRSS